MSNKFIRPEYIVNRKMPEGRISMVGTANFG